LMDAAGEVGGFVDCNAGRNVGADVVGEGEGEDVDVVAGVGEGGGGLGDGRADAAHSRAGPLVGEKRDPHGVFYRTWSRSADSFGR
jgi:hypothetical protein